MVSSTYTSCIIVDLDRVIEWSTHEPRQGEYHFSGNSDLEAFIRTAQRLGLDVILRIGPYICAERDMVSETEILNN